MGTSDVCRRKKQRGHQTKTHVRSLLHKALVPTPRDESYMENCDGCAEQARSVEMDTGMIIGSVVALVIMAMPLVIYFKTKDRKETLTIWIKDDTVWLLLNDDEYADFDISDIRDNQKRVDEELVKVVNARAKELVKFIDRVTFFESGREEFEKELLEIIQKG